ncbi:MAG TPA: YggT family protein [Burkholderiales bacterium]|nr:YggT family protein [Burkholderiales bacterium]
MLTNALIFLVSTGLGLLTVALLLRFYLQWARAPYRNPLSEFLVALTDFMVRPARRVIPGLWGLDLATLALAWLLQLLEFLAVLQLRGYQGEAQAGQVFAALVVLALVTVVKLALYIVMAVVIAHALLSWIAPHSPVMPLLGSLSRPFLRPFQRRVPPLGGVDLSPLLVVIAAQLLLMLPVAYLEAAVARWL